MSEAKAGGCSARYTWYVIILLTVVNAFNYIDRIAVSVLAPSIQADFELTDAQLGLLVGFAFSIFYAICGIPLARWADHGIRRNIVAWAVAVWSLMTALSGATHNFLQLFAARIGVGAGEAGGLAPASSLLCDYVSLKRRPVVFAIYNFGLYAGMMLGLVGAGWLSDAIGWRLTFLTMGLPGIGLALLVRFTVQEPQRGFYDAAAADQARLPLGRTVRTLWISRTYRILLLYLVMNAFLQFGLVQWWPTFYTRVFGLQMSFVGANLGLALGIGSAIGMLTGGILANRAGQRDVRYPLFMGAIAIAMILPVASASLFVKSPYASFTLVSLTALLWSVPIGPVVAMVLSVVRPQMRATGAAVSTLAYSLLGYGLGPYCIGVLSDLLAPSQGHLSLRYALLAPIICVIPLMAATLCVAARTVRDDVRATDAS